MNIMINGQMLHQSNICAVVLTTQILSVLSVVPNIYQYSVKLDKMGKKVKVF